jgi:hypothetical protein
MEQSPEMEAKNGGLLLHEDLVSGWGLGALRFLGRFLFFRDFGHCGAKTSHCQQTSKTKTKSFHISSCTERLFGVLQGIHTQHVAREVSLHAGNKSCGKTNSLGIAPYTP